MSAVAAAGRRGFRYSWEWYVVAAAIAAAWVLRNSFGMGWDDDQHARYGSFVLDYFLSGGADSRWRHDLGLLFYYGPLFDLLSAALHRILGANLHTYRPFLMAVSGALAIPAVAGIARRLGGERAAAFSVSALLLMPQFVGQSFINCKDIPFATGMAWSALAILRLLERTTALRFALFGLAAGITMSIRIGGILAFVFLGAAMLFRAILAGPRSIKAGAIPAVRCWTPGLILAFFTAWACVYVSWPLAREFPLRGPWEAFTQASAFPTTYPVLFGGAIIPSDHLPLSYLPAMLFLTQPLVLIALMAAGFANVLRRLPANGGGFDQAAGFLVLFWIGFPLAYVAAVRPNIYDGMRHFLFLLPALAVLAGSGAGEVSSWLDRKVPRTGIAIIAVILALAAPAMVRTHPYQYTFYNICAGPRATLHERFETDYWLTSYRDAAEVLNQEQASQGRPLSVLAGASPLAFPCFSEFAARPMRAGWFFVRERADKLPEGIDFSVATPRWGLSEYFHLSPVFHEIRSDGALLCVIRSAGTAGRSSVPR